MTDRDVAIRAAQAGAEVIRAWFGRDPHVELKGGVDPVTAADQEAEQVILSVISAARPDDAFLAEESGETAGTADRRWIIDPLDGTINFIHGIPHVGVSVALYRGQQPLVGVIVDVFRKETFSAEVAEGASVDGRPLRVSERSELNESLIVTGFPYDRQQHAFDYIRSLGAVLQRVRGVRRVGSAALDFAYVADGRYDAFWEFLLAPWDVAAGLLLVREAGGVVVDHRGEPFQVDAPVVLAGGAAVVERLIPLISEHLPPHVLQ